MYIYERMCIESGGAGGRGGLSWVQPFVICHFFSKWEEKSIAVAFNLLWRIYMKYNIHDKNEMNNKYIYLNACVQGAYW